MCSLKTLGKHLHTNVDLAKKCANVFPRFYMKKKARTTYLVFIGNIRKTFAHKCRFGEEVCKCFPYVFNENQIGCSCFLFHVKRTENICTLLNQTDICVQMFSLRFKGKHFADFWRRSVQMFSLCFSFLSCF